MVPLRKKYSSMVLQSPVKAPIVGLVMWGSLVGFACELRVL